MLRTQITTWQEHETELRAIRQAVFVEEQKVPEALEWDDEDAHATHFLVWSEDNQPLATARLIRDRPTQARIGRFAVLKEFRRHGLASRLIRYVIGYARSQAIEVLTLSAQTSARGLYERCGFVAEGDEYLEADIPHIRMSQRIRETPETAPKTLGKDHTVYRIHSQQEALSHLWELLPQARQQITILSYDLEKGVLDDENVLEGLAQLARRSASTSIRILAGEDRTAVKTSNRLLPLARRLSSCFDLRLLKPEVTFPEQVYVLVDDQGLLLRHNHNAWEGFCHYSDPGLVRRLNEEFQNFWNYSQPSLEFRQLRL